jgi:hypothetical protein
MHSSVLRAWTRVWDSAARKLIVMVYLNRFHCRPTKSKAPLRFLSTSLGSAAAASAEAGLQAVDEVADDGQDEEEDDDDDCDGNIAGHVGGCSGCLGGLVGGLRSLCLGGWLESKLICSSDGLLTLIQEKLVSCGTVVVAG